MPMTHSNRDGRLAQIQEAVRRGRCDCSEGVPMNLNPYNNSELREAWLVGWSSVKMPGVRTQVVS